MLADGDDSDNAFTNSEIVSPGSTITYLVTLDNDSDVGVAVLSLVDDTFGDVNCMVEGTSENAIGLALAPDDGDKNTFDGGSDELQCLYEVAAPNDPGVINNVTTATVGDSGGSTASDFDDAPVTVQ